MDENVNFALGLLERCHYGVLATQSTELPGYPFGSLTPYVLDDQFRPIILVSDIAQHTKNINEDSKVSLTVLEEVRDEEKQAHSRVTFIGDAKRVEGDDSIKEKYFRYFPESKSYMEAHGFAFYAITLKRLRYIGGFGKIYWIEPEQWPEENKLTFEEQMGIIDHMNSDHTYNLVDYCRHYFNMTTTEDNPPAMIGINQFGCDLLIQKKKLHFEFQVPVCTTSEARGELVRMAKESKQKGA